MNFIIVVVWSSLSASDVLCGMFKLIRCIVYSVHCSIICFIMSVVWHISHMGCSSLLINEDCVRKVRPILIRVIAKFLRQ